MITYSNYHDSITNVDFSTLPEALRKGHEFVKKATNNGATWDNYHASETIKKTVDTYFAKLDDFLKSRRTAAQPKAAKIAKGKAPVKKAASPKAAKSKKSARADMPQPEWVERIPDELRFIRRFVNLDCKTKTRDELLRFINSLQKAILEKKIRKTSPYAQKIRFVQDMLIETCNSMKDKVLITLKPETRDELLRIVNEEKVLSSVSLIKRYINLNGKAGMKDKAKLLLGQINRGHEKGAIKDSDPYIMELHQIKKNLESYLGEKSAKVLEIEKSALNGLQGIVNGCACQSLHGIGNEDEDATPAVVMSSMEFANMKFKTLGLKGKWRDLIGDPSTNFSMMVFGKPKMGKSYLCVDFAGYLARNHGKVLYVAREEGLDKTLQDKLNDKDVKHPNLYVASALPANLALYDFIFLDSVNKLGLTPEDLNKLRKIYPQKSFVYVFQTTKGGNFRGANTFQHDVDSVIEVPERGLAVQYGRFNQGGEVSIF